MKLFLSLIITVNILSGCAKAQYYNNGTIWKDTDGKHINAHGGGVIFQNGTYYWYGEFKRGGNGGNKAKDGVSCYSSTDLKNWKNEGLALKMIDDEESDLQSGSLIERPKVIYNKKYKKYVMWFHHELKGQGYDAALAGVAVADEAIGPFKYIKSIRVNKGYWPVNFPDSVRKPLAPHETTSRKDKQYNEKRRIGYLTRRDFEAGQMSRDMTLFVDDDPNETAYQITSTEDNATLLISQLTDDYQSFTGEYYRVLPAQSNEAPALIKHQGKYYLIASGTTGWDPNPARSYVADKITGPYKSLGNPVRGTDEDRATTFHSQSTHILPVQGKKETYIYMGDRWTPGNAIDGRYVWLPLTFEDGKPVIKMFK